MAELSVHPEPRLESDAAISALRFARRVHLGQYRKQTGEQFVTHPIAVAELLAEAGYGGGRGGGGAAGGAGGGGCLPGRPPPQAASKKQMGGPKKSGGLGGRGAPPGAAPP